MDALHLLDLTMAVGAPAARFAHLLVMAQAADQLTFELATRMQIDGIVDGLVGHRFFWIFGQRSLSLRAICSGDQSKPSYSNKAYHSETGMPFWTTEEQ